ncbi:hypothetical protein [Streptomyces hesseae]|uniref:Uncharacterized protein n=1 Tax=Streptomyces hesseae TaxID=3075519 RepID=A0ABU2SRV8_9ACTN|nr:hypothetical protein [Streptomyces sp. DSM 40473]MDT0450755.1 hypothetical protein [Streptomyces sp. DSM 40473]
MRDLISRLLRRNRARGAVRTAPAPVSPTPAPAVLSLPHTSGVHRPSPPPPPCTCPGAFVYDTHRDRVGQVTGHEGPRLQLRPPAGGCEWEAEPTAVRPASDTERLSAKLAVVNSRGRWGK